MPAQHGCPTPYNAPVLREYIEQAVRRSGIRPSRARGQHFLIDDSVLADIIRAAQLDGSEYVVEIGPGLGTLTTALANRCHRLHAFELDEKIVRYLQGWVLPDTRNVVLHDVAFNKYVLEPVLDEASAEGRPVKFVTNLPYQISSAFLHTVVEYAGSIGLTVVMLQREVAQRVVARVGDPGFNSFSLYLQTFLGARWVCDVPEDCFLPPPKVASAVIALHPLAETEQPQPRDRSIYFKLIEGVFRHRRKQMQNALRLAFSHLTPEQAASVLETSGIAASARPQELGMAQYVILADSLFELKNDS